MYVYVYQFMLTISIIYNFACFFTLLVFLTPFLDFTMTIPANLPSFMSFYLFLYFNQLSFMLGNLVNIIGTVL
jgi:hypothetical protein